MESKRVLSLIKKISPWDLDELSELSTAINALIESRFGDPLKTFDECGVAHQAAIAVGKQRAGYIEIKPIGSKGKVYGNYRYLRYRTNGKLKSVYLGKVCDDDDS